MDEIELETLRQLKMLSQEIFELSTRLNEKYPLPLILERMAFFVGYTARRALFSPKRWKETENIFIESVQRGAVFAEEVGEESVEKRQE